MPAIPRYRWLFVALAWATLGGASWQAQAAPKQPAARSSRKAQAAKPQAKLAAIEAGVEAPDPWPGRGAAPGPVCPVLDVVEPWSAPIAFASINDESLAEPWPASRPAPSRPKATRAPKPKTPEGHDAATLVDPWPGRSQARPAAGKAAIWSSTDSDLVDPWRGQPAPRASTPVDLIDPWSR